MKKLKPNEAGFIPLLLSILALVVLVIFFAYARVAHVQK
jgi:hypothetical protein